MKEEKIWLRSFTEQDSGKMTILLQNKQIAKTYMLPDFENEEAARNLFERLRKLSLEPDRFVRGIFYGDELVGFLNDVQIEGTRIELGYVIDPACQNRGYATRALGCAIEELFQKGFSEVITGAFVQNAASIAVMRKNGMQRMDLEEDIEYRGQIHRCVYYKKTK